MTTKHTIKWVQSNKNQLVRHSAPTNFFFLNLINCFISAKSPSESPEKLPTSEPNIESDEIENVLAKAKEMMNNVEPISSLSGKCIHYV